MATQEKSDNFSKQIQKMFSAIAPRYDFLNALLSCGQDRHWRKKAIKMLAPKSGEQFLDLATGTGDMAIEIARRVASRDVRITAVDFSEEMLKLGNKKVREKGLEKAITLLAGDGEYLPFRSGSFNGVVIAFGIRNFSDTIKGLGEMLRTLKPGGKLVVLEFSLPQTAFLKLIYKLYFNYILPLIGRLVSGHQDAYKYLPESVSGFPDRDEFMGKLESAGFKNVGCKELTFGIVTVYTGLKNV